MRYIGNKTRLLRFITDVLRARRVARGVAVDPFTGTASVARELKRHGFAVTASDIMEYGYVFARAYVEVTAPPLAPELAAHLGLPDGTLASLLDHLNGLTPAPGFLHENFSPAGESGRMYFTPRNAAHIDAARHAIHDWREAGRIENDAYHTLLAALLEAADRVANTTGVYAAFVKSWQPNALKRLELRAPDQVRGNSCHAARRDALDTVRGAGDFELLYLDPPYNGRQYAGYYHIPELIATGWFDSDVRTRGKTGLVDDEDKRSDWSRSRRCEAAFEELIAAARCRQIVMSYNAEGLIPEPTIERVLKAHGRRRTYRRYAYDYRRYRSDTDGDNRRYKADRVTEYLYCVSR